MIGAHGICRYFRQPDGTLFKALDDVNLEIGDGELAVIAGENGSGKSLLMKILAGLEKPTRGTVQADAMGLVFQDADAQILADTPLEDVLFGLRNRRDITKAQKRDIAVDSLSKVGLKDIADLPICSRAVRRDVWRWRPSWLWAEGPWCSTSPTATWTTPE